MVGYKWQQAGTTCEAVGLFHHRSVALCPGHARVVSEPVTR